MLTAALLVVFPFAMIYAAASDLVSMTIANRVPIVLSIVFLLVAAASGMTPAVVGGHVAVGLAALAVVFAFFSFGWMGGGDAKLIAATMLWFGPTMAAAEYLMLASILGGTLTIGLLALRAHLAPATGVDFVDRLLQAETGVPYGIALGIAGLAVYGGSEWLALAVAGAL